MKAFNIVCCILFLISAIIQYNDVDPLLWILLYGYGAWVCYQTARGRYLIWSYGLGIAVYFAFVLYFLIFKHGAVEWFQHHQATDLVQSMKADKPWIEETREVLGLLILIVVLGIDWFVAVKRKKQVAAT